MRRSSRASSKPTPKARAVRQSAGSIAYAELVLRSSHAALARRLGVSEASSRAMAAAQRKPGEGVRVKLEALGIPSESWDASPRRRPGRRPPAAPPAPTSAAVPASSEPVTPLEVTRDTIARLQRELDRLDQDPLATAQQRAGVSSALVSATRLFARLSGALDVTREQLLRSPHWRPLMGAIVAALEPFEGAVEAVARTLRDFEAEGRA